MSQNLILKGTLSSSYQLGIDGATIYCSVDNPAPEIGVDGDMFIVVDGALSSFFMKRASGWETVSNSALSSIGVIDPDVNTVMVGSGTNWRGLNGTDLRTALGLGQLNDPIFRNLTTTSLESNGITINGTAVTAGISTMGSLTDASFTGLSAGEVVHYNGSVWVNSPTGALSGVQGHSSLLDSIASLSPGLNYFIVGDGVAWGIKSDNNARNALSLGTSQTPTFAGINLSSGSIGVNSVVRGSVGNASLFTDVGTGTVTIGGTNSSVTIPGNLSVTGTFTAVNSTTLEVTDKTVIVNSGGTTAGATLSGLEIEGDAAAIVGYLRSGTDNSVLEFKAPTGSPLTLDINGTSSLTINGALTVSGTSVINQNVGTSGTPSFVTLSLTGTGTNTVTGSMVVGSPTGGSQGTGTINAVGLFINGTAVSTTGGGATTLNGLSDVDAPSPSINDILKYNGTAWINGTASSGGSLDGLSDVVITSPGTNQIIIYNGTNWVNGTASGGGSLDGLSDVVITSAGSGQVIYNNGTNWVNGATGTASGVQPYDADLAALAALSQGSNNIIMSNGSNWTAATPAAVATALGVGTASAVTHSSLTLNGSLGVTGTGIFGSGSNALMVSHNGSNGIISSAAGTGTLEINATTVNISGTILVGGIPFVGGDTLDGFINPASSINHFLDLTGTTVTDGYTYSGTGRALVTSIMVANTDAVGEYQIKAWIRDNSGTADHPIAFNVPVPAGMSVELLRQPKVLEPSDKLKFQSNGTNAFQIVTTVAPYGTNTKLFNSFNSLSSAGTNITVYTESGTAGSVINSILLANNESGTENGVLVDVLMGDGSSDYYLTRSMNLPAKSSIELCEQTKFLGTSGTIKVKVSDASRCTVSVSGRKL